MNLDSGLVISEGNHNACTLALCWLGLFVVAFIYSALFVLELGQLQENISQNAACPVVLFFFCISVRRLLRLYLVLSADTWCNSPANVMIWNLIMP